MALRFFIGILGGSFVPCQVWSTGFFDKNVVGTANALTGGLGNAGGGITYFLMPAIFDSLVANQHLTPHVAWRVAFIVPFICITVTAVAMLVCCPDTPTGKWSERHLHAAQNLANHGITGDVVDVPGELTDKKPELEGSESPSVGSNQEKMQYAATGKRNASYDHEAQIGEQQLLDTARGEVVVKPTFKEAMTVVFSLQTLVLAGCYFCSFGSELAINSILGSYYVKNFSRLGQTGSGNWAAMFGLLNVFFRPLGGALSDFLYTRSGVWGKKVLMHSYGIITGAFLIAIGLKDPHDESMMFGLVAGMAFFLEGGNGANFSLVPHVHPFANGTSSPSSLFSLLVYKLTYQSPRHRLRRHRRIRQSGRHRLRHRLPLPPPELRQGDLDHWHHERRHQSFFELDPTHSQGPDWWSLRFFFFFLAMNPMGVVAWGSHIIGFISVCTVFVGCR